MAYLPIQVAGGTYRHTDLTLSAQRTINFWPQVQDSQASKKNYIIESFLGLKRFGSNSGANRGIFEHLGVVYKINDQTLYSVSSSGVFTSLGSIPGDSRAVFSGLGTSVVITADGVAYEWNGSTLTIGTDVDFETPNTVTVINNQAIYDGDGGRFGVSDVGSPLSINALNYATAEFYPDDIVRPYSFGTVVTMFCDTHYEQWWNNTNVTDPPFSRIEGSAINIGLQAQNSVANDDNVVYFFADDNQVYALTGSVPTPLLPKVIVREIKTFTTKSDAIGWTMSIDGQWFYVLKFPAADRTFIYPKGGEWFELSSGTEGGRYNGDGYAFGFGKHLIADEVGNIFELDQDTYDEDNLPIRRVRTFSPIHSGLFGQPGRELEISLLRLNGKTGTGILSGQGSNPQILLQYAKDGENFATEIWADVGIMGQMTEVIFDIGESHESWIFRIISTDPVYSNWHTAGIEVEIGI